MNWLRVLAALLLLSGPSWGQASSASAPVTQSHSRVSPDDGSVKGQTYSSSYFAFTYTFPAELKVDPDFMAGQEDISKRTFILFVAYGPTAENGRRETLVLTADKLPPPRHGRKLPAPGTPEAATPSPEKRAENPDDAWVQPYLETLKKVLVNQGAEPAPGLRDYTFGGNKFFRADFEREGPGVQSLLLTRRGGYALVFDLVGAGEQQVDKLVDSLSTLKFGEEPHTTNAP